MLSFAQLCTWETYSLLDDVLFLGYHLVATVESVILPVAVATAWYEHELLLGAAAQVRKFHYLRMSGHCANYALSLHYVCICILQLYSVCLI